MKLYKEYREEQQRQKKEEKDRKEAELEEQVVIIYEQSTFLTLVKEGMQKLLGVLLFLAVLGVIGGGILWLLTIL